MDWAIAVFCTVGFLDLVWSPESKNSTFDRLRKGAMLSFKIRVNCERSKVEQQKTTRVFDIATTGYVRVSRKAKYFVDKLFS